MKKIIFRDPATGKIMWDKDYGELLSVFGSEQKLDDEIERRRRLGLPSEIAELDDIAEYYAKKSRTCHYIERYGKNRSATDGHRELSAVFYQTLEDKQ